MIRETWVLAVFYTVLYAVLGVWIPYWPLYMNGLGYGPEAIGLVISLSMLVKILGPPVWGGLADRGSRRTVIIASSIGTCLAATLFFLEGNLLILVSAVLLFSFFQNGPLSLVESTTMETVARLGGDYGRVRLWPWGWGC